MLLTLLVFNKVEIFTNNFLILLNILIKKVSLLISLTHTFFGNIFLNIATYQVKYCGMLYYYVLKVKCIKKST